MSIPGTIYDPNEFMKSPPAGFDGWFDWEYLRGACPRGIMPMDIDGLIEIRRRFLIFETKKIGASIPDGQRQALSALVSTSPAITLIKQWGKDKPAFLEIQRHDFKSHRIAVNEESAWEFVHWWADAVENNASDGWISELAFRFCERCASAPVLILNNVVPSNSTDGVESVGAYIRGEASR